MKKLRWVSDKNKLEYMKHRQDQNRAACLRSKAESWANERLAETGLKWTRQAIWGYRLFDFWNANLGCAVEIDGMEHNPEYDAYRDEYNFRRSGIVVLRVRNHNEGDMRLALTTIGKLPLWKERRHSLGLLRNTKKERRELADRPYDSGSMLSDYIRTINAA